MKTIILIFIGVSLGISFSIYAENITWWKPSNNISQLNNKTAEVQIWCELRTERIGWENYCRWTGKYWGLTCLGVERLFGKRIEPINGSYGCKDIKSEKELKDN